MKSSLPADSRTFTVAEALVQMLLAAHIDVGFGVPGGQTMPFYAAARRSAFRHVLMRDERNAACAADAYARISSRVGFCDATLGPGATNLISGLAEAYSSSVPVLALVADVRTNREHLRERGVASQALDQRPLFASISKWFGRVQTPDSIADMFKHALRVAVSGRPGPVVLEIPEDVLAMSCSMSTAWGELTSGDSRWPRHRSVPVAEEITELSRRLRSAKRPIVLAGGGAVASGADELVWRLAEHHGLPVVTSINGKGAIAETHARAFGVVGVFGSTRATCALRQADLVLALGTKFAQFNSFMFRLPGASQSTVQVDLDASELGRTIPISLGVTGDVRETLVELLKRLDPHSRFDWSPVDDAPAQPGTAAGDPALAPEALVEALSEVSRKEDVLVSDASLASGWAASRYRVKSAGRRFIAPRGLAGIGWAGGAAIGAAMARGRSQARIVALAGDGAAGYWLGEIETAVRFALPITYVILNNGSYGWIVQGERMLGIAPESNFGKVDFAMIARGLGAYGVTVRKGDDLVEAVRQAHRQPGPALIDALTSSYAQPSVDWGTFDASARSKYGAYGMG